MYQIYQQRLQVLSRISSTANIYFIHPSSPAMICSFCFAYSALPNNFPSRSSQNIQRGLLSWFSCLSCAEVVTEVVAAVGAAMDAAVNVNIVVDVDTAADVDILPRAL